MLKYVLTPQLTAQGKWYDLGQGVDEEEVSSTSDDKLYVAWQVSDAPNEPHRWHRKAAARIRAASTPAKAGPSDTGPSLPVDAGGGSRVTPLDQLAQVLKCNKYLKFLKHNLQKQAKLSDFITGEHKSNHMVRL